MKEAGSSHSGVAWDLLDNTDVTDSALLGEDSSDGSDVVVVVVVEGWLVVVDNVKVVVVDILVVVVDVEVEVLVEVMLDSSDWFDMVQLL